MVPSIPGIIRFRSDEVGLRLRKEESASDGEASMVDKSGSIFGSLQESFIIIGIKLFIVLINMYIPTRPTTASSSNS